MPRPEPPEPGVVQLLTIHGSKGLEWDAVAVVRLVRDELPKRPKTTLGWLGYGVLPYAFRGDRAALPALAWHPDDDVDRRALTKAINDFKAENRAHQEREERRLAYVAVTRARRDLMLSGSRWGGQRDAREPSVYLTEMIERLGLEPIVTDDDDVNPYEGRAGLTLRWPLDPLGARGDRVRAAAAEVDRALARPDRPAPSPELDRLLRERAARAQPVLHEAPPRVAASRFKDFVGDYQGTLRSIARPLPERPFRQTRLGTLFHAWVEQRSGLAGLGTSLDDALWETDDDDVAESEASAVDATALEELRATFLASEWADLAPIEVETEIDITLAGAEGLGTVVCKLDAVYRRGDRIEIVDWKTGRPPANDADMQERMLQLALYRLAYHKRHGVPLEQIDVTLFYVSDDLVLRSDHVLSEEELVQRWNAARAARSGSSSASVPA
jgi:DNA helicase-2/ATP-dependent DNA helicase PcrA